MHSTVSRASTNSPLSSSYVSRMDFLRKQCHGKSVMHLGCSSGRYLKDRLERGSLLHAVLAQEAEEMHGIDLDEQSLQEMRSLGFTNLHHGNAERLDNIEIGKKFDIVVAGDLLEHLTRPGAMLDGVKHLLAPRGRFIVSTVNAFGLHFQLRRWSGRYVEHFEHVCFYSPETLAHLFERHGYHVVEMHGAFTEPPHTWKQKMKFMLGAPLLRVAPVLAGTLIVVAEMNNSGGQQLD
jgi:2-polyprenyl-3-methyl-5-hydroxy-6-metoxy-1,4-benzoquinol methylase